MTPQPLTTPLQQAQRNVSNQKSNFLSRLFVAAACCTVLPATIHVANQHFAKYAINQDWTTRHVIEDMVGKDLDRHKKDAVDRIIANNKSGTFNIAVEGSIDRDAVEKEATRRIEERKNDSKSAFFLFSGLCVAIGAGFGIGALVARRKLKTAEQELETLKLQNLVP